MHATGPFDVKITSARSVQQRRRRRIEPDVHRQTIPRRSRSDEQGRNARGDGSRRNNPADYTAIERVTGTLGGRKGSFVLQHSSTMTRGKPNQHIFVVPDSGTAELAGLSGSMIVNIASGGAHSYEFDYAFDNAQVTALTHGKSLYVTLQIGLPGREKFSAASDQFAHHGKRQHREVITVLRTSLFLILASVCWVALGGCCSDTGHG